MLFSNPNLIASELNIFSKCHLQAWISFLVQPWSAVNECFGLSQIRGHQCNLPEKFSWVIISDCNVILKWYTNMEPNSCNLWKSKDISGHAFLTNSWARQLKQTRQPFCLCTRKLMGNFCDNTALCDRCRTEIGLNPSTYWFPQLILDKSSHSCITYWVSRWLRICN